MVSRDSIHHNTDRNREAPLTINDSDRRIPENQFDRVSHFNPTGIALIAFRDEEPMLSLNSDENHIPICTIRSCISILRKQNNQPCMGCFCVFL